MKKGFLLLLTALLLLSVSLEAQTIVLNESFEDGIPTTWTQENVVGSQSWVVESEGMYPTGSFAGTKHVALRNGTEQTIGYKTRLITPMMDLSQVYQPILKFAYAQARWTMDFDTLCVFYRTSSKDDWRILKQYNIYQNDWTTDIILLPAVTASYQLAFEGSDNLGRGIVLDTIQVRSMPECTTPHDLNVLNMTDGGATLGWQASLDANYFQIILTTIEISPDTLDNVATENIALNYKMEADSNTYRAEKLVPGQYYWFYVRSLCDKENSDWGSYAFRMNATAQIPYSELFDAFAYSAGRVSRMPAWTYGGTAQTPYIPTNASSLTYYSALGYCLAFAGSESIDEPIPGGYLSYAVTPELAGADLKNCQLTFLASVADHTGLRAHACGLIIGIMTNPDDISTLTVIDTVYVWSAFACEEKIVNLNKYTGNGRYICFISDFNLPNNIYVDNISVKADKPKVTNVKVNPKDTEVVVSWDKAEGAVSYNVAVTTNPVGTPSETVAKQEGVTATSVTLSGLEAGHNVNRPYYVYVQAVYADGTSEWTYRKPFITSKTGSLPMAFSLEIADGQVFQLSGGNAFSFPNDLSLYGNHKASSYIYPYLKSGTAHGSGNASLYQNKLYGEDAWVVLPRLSNADLKKAQVTFFLSASSQMPMAVGVMENPSDLSTFVQISEFRNGQPTFSRCVADFADYTGNGEYIAFVWLDADNKMPNNSYIDDITVAVKGDCSAPTGVTVDASATKATVTWGTAGKVKWQVLLANSFFSDDFLASMDVSAQNTAIESLVTVETTPTYTFEELIPASKYYVYVRSECNGAYSDWTSAMPFTMECLPVQTTPYTEAFDTYGTGSATSPTCWYTDYDFSYTSAGTRYPYVDATNHGTEAGGSLYMSGVMSATSNPKVYSVIVAPKLDIPVNKVRVKFYTNSLNVANVLYVGTMSNPADYSTFHVYATITPNAASTWEEQQVDFGSYTGNDEYIAFSNKQNFLTQDNIYIDDVTFASSECAMPVNIRTTSINDRSMTLAWDGSTTDKWNVVVSKVEGTITDGDLTGVVSIVDTAVTENILYVDGLDVATMYYVYVRSTCGLQEWGSGSAQTECTKINPRKKNREGFDDLGASTTSYSTAKKLSNFCWTSGNIKSTSASYQPFIYKTTTYAPSQPNSARIYASSATTGPAWMCSPEIDVDDMSTLLVSFSGYASSSQAFIFGVMSDPNDPYTFTVLDSITGSAKLLTYAMDMSGYKDKIPADAKHIAFRTPYGKTSTFYLDNFSAVIYTCPNPNPVISNVTSNSARAAAGMRESTPWRLIVSTKQLIVDSLSSSTYTIPASYGVLKDTILGANVRYYNIKNLDENTTYYCAFGAICDTTTSMFFTQTFTTTCRPVALADYPAVSFEPVEGYAVGSGKNLQCWLSGNKNSSSATYVPKIADDFKTAHNGTFFLGFNTTSTANGAYAIMPALDIDSISKVQVHFYGYAPASSTYARGIIVGVLTDPTDLSTFVGIDTIYVTGDAVYRPYTVSFNEYEGDYMGDQGKHVCFLSEFLQSNQFYIDDVSLDYAPACPAPRDIRVNSINDGVANVSWKGIADTYRVVVSSNMRKNDLDPKVVKELTVTSHSVNIEDLPGGKQYYIYVQAVCSEDVVSDYCFEPAVLNMPCPERYELPYVCDFDHNSVYGEGLLPDCWDGVYAGSNATSIYPYIAFEGGNDDGALVLYSALSTKTRSIVVLPDLNTPDLSQYALSLHARKMMPTSGTALILGCVSTQASDINKAFVALDTISINFTDYRRYYVDLSAWQAELIGKRLAFKADATVDKANIASFMVDNVKVIDPASCIAPNLESINVDKTSATIDIEPVAGQSKWDIAIIPFSDNIDMTALGTTATIQTVTTPSATFTGLVPGTQYAAFVRALCSDTEKSDWDDMGYDFITVCDYTNGYFFGFEREEGWVRSPKSTSDKYYMHPNLEAGTITGTTYERNAYAHEDDNYYYAATGTGALCLSSTKLEQGAYVIFPAVTSTDACAFSFDVRPGYANGFNSQMAYVSSNNTFKIGTVAEGKGIESFEELGSVTLPTYTMATPINAANNYLYEHYVINFAENDLKGRRLAFIDKTAESTNLHIDNVKLDAPEAYSTPLMSYFFAADNYVDIEFVSNDIMTAYIVPGIVTELDKNDSTVMTFPNIQKSCHLTGTSAQSTYTIFIEVNNVPDNVKTLTTVKRTFTTYCAAMPLDEHNTYVCSFDDNAYTLVNKHYIPDCWITGTTSTATTNTWSVAPLKMSCTFSPPSSAWSMNPDGLSPGRNKTPSIYYSVTSASNTGAYAIMPLVDCDFENTQLTFYLRTFMHNVKTGKFDIDDSPMISTSYPNALAVGACTNPTDISTYTPIDTVEWPYAQKVNVGTLMSSDPNGLEYWYKVTLPLSTAKGGFITFMNLYPIATFIDDITFEPINQLFTPKGLTISGATSSSLIAKWTQEWHPNLQTIVRLYANDKTTILFTDTINPGIKTYTFTGLQSNTEYMVTLAQFNDSMVSKETDFVGAFTECVAVDASYTSDFENGEGRSRMISGQSDARYQQTNCWVYGNAGSSTVWSNSYFPYNFFTFGSSCAQRSGDACVKLYSTSTTYQGFIVTPRMENVDMDTLQIEFWGIPDTRSPEDNTISYAYNIASNYAKSVEVGTCTDPNDLTTFVPLRTCTYSLTYAKGDVAPAPDHLYEHFYVPLKGAVGPYVYIMSTLTDADGQKKTYNIMYIDDVSFSHYTECEPTSEIVQTDRSISSVSFEWTSNIEQCIVEVATTGYFESNQIVYSDTLSSTNHVYGATVTGLDAHKTYYARARAMCGPRDLSVWSPTATLTTTIVPYWYEDFRSAAMKDSWTYGTTEAAALFADQTGATKMAGENNSTYGWKRDTKGYGVAGAHMYIPFYAANGVNYYDNFWMITPTIQIPLSEDNVHMTWDMALTTSSGTNLTADPLADEGLIQPEYNFMVVISDDGGKTWKRENATVWSNGTKYGTADYELTSIPAKGVTYTLDLSEFVGKDIKIGFYKESKNYYSTTAAVSIGNVRVNFYKAYKTEMNRCRYEDADAYGMHIDGEDAEGEITVTRYALVSEYDLLTGPKADTAYTLVANYLPMPMASYSATICEGRTFTDYDFAAVSQNGIYRRKVISSTGCDSITTLYLSTTPTIRVTEENTICPGETIVWNGQTINRSGMYSDTIASAVTGCDSITSLVLTVLSAGDTLMKEVIITEDDLPYSYESITYPIGTKPGVYTDTIYVQSGECKGVLIHKLTINVGSDLEEIIDINALQSGVHKVLIREQLYIVRDGKWYDALGKLVDCPL